MRAEPTVLNKFAITSLVVSCVIFSIAPLLWSGYYSDDLVNSSAKGLIGLRGVSLWVYIADQFRAWAIDNGRIFPIAFIVTVPISYLLPDFEAHKFAVVLIVVVDLLLLQRLLKLLTGNFYAACLGVLLLSILFQFRLTHDPILSFSGLLPTLVGLLLSSLILFYDHLSSRWRGPLIGSLLLYNLCLYTYEISIPLVMLFPILAVANEGASKGWRTAARSWPFVVSAVVAIALNLAARGLKSPDTAGYPGIAFSWDALLIAKTFCKQLLATFPLSYLAFDPTGLFAGPQFARFDLEAAVAAAVFCGAFWFLSKRVAGVRAQPLLLVGSALLLGSSCLVSLSTKYQNSLEPGIGYLPVYAQYFGLSMLLIAGFVFVQRRLTPVPQLVLRSVSCALLLPCFLLNVQANRAVVDKANIDSHFRRQALVDALKSGLLDGVPEQSIVLIEDAYAYDPRPDVRSRLRYWAEVAYPWKSDALLYQYTSRRFMVVDSRSELISRIEAAAPHFATRSAYVLRIESYPPDMKTAQAFVVLSQARSVLHPSFGATDVALTQVKQWPQKGP